MAKPSGRSPERKLPVVLSVLRGEMSALPPPKSATACLDAPINPQLADAPQKARPGCRIAPAQSSDWLADPGGGQENRPRGPRGLSPRRVCAPATLAIVGSVRAV